MNNLLFSNVFLLSSVISLLLTVYVIIYRKDIVFRSISILMFAISIWSLFYGLELRAESYEKLIFFVKIQYVGIVSIPIIWLLFASRYTGKDHWICAKNILFISVIPVVNLIMVNTNQLHNLFYKTTTFKSTAFGIYHEFDPGIFYWIHIVYSYLIILIALFMVITTMISVSKDNRFRVFLVLLSSFIPYLFSFLYIIGVRPEGNIDLTPIGFLLTGIILLFGLLNSNLLDFKPLVLNSLFESLPDAIIATDLNNRIISTNPKAAQMINDNVIDNQQIHQFIHAENYFYNSETDTHFIEIQSDKKTFRIEKSEICNSRKRKTGTMFLLVDITQEKKYREALKQSEEKYKILFDNAQEGIVVIQNRHLVFFNPMILKLTGYNSIELQSMPINNLIHDADFQVIEEVYARVSNDDRFNFKINFRLKVKDGSFCWVEFSSVLIEWNGRKAGLLFINDISEKKQAEELKELLISISNTYINAPIENYELTVNQSLKEMGEFVNADRSYIFEYDWVNSVCNNTFEWCAAGINAEIENLQQIPLDAIPQWVDTHKNKFPMYVNDVSKLEMNSGLREILESQGIKSLITIPLMDAEKCLGFVGFDSVKSLHKYSEKEKVLLQVFAQMIVNLENRKISNEFIQNQLKVQALVNEISSDMISADTQSLDAKIMSMLNKTGEFFGVDRSYMLRYSDNKTIENNTHEWCANDICSQKESLTNVKLSTFPWWSKQIESKSILYIKDTAQLPEEAAIEKEEFARQGIKSLLCFPIINNNNLIGYFGFDSVLKHREWTENQMGVIEVLTNILGDTLIRVETEQELIRSKDLAEAASVAKSNFLSNMSHEIRTPLNGVIGFTELLRNTQLNKTQKEYLENAINSANSLLSVISDILDFSKIESGKLEIETVKTDIIQLFENSSDIIKILASNKGLELLLNIDPNIPRFAHIDPIRIKQILVNLLSNAVKFTHVGEIEMSLRFEQKTKHTGIFSVQVRDTGIGIREEDRNKLFKAFSQADTSTTRRYGGTGLGLIISNSLANKMGSEIDFRSEYGKGTTFFFDIECKFENGEAIEYKHIKNINKVLVVDDNSNNRLILEHTFNFWEIEFCGVDNGSDALEILKSGEKFDLIIVDYHMPDMNGIETIKHIREEIDNVYDNQPIIMLHSSSDDLMLHEEAKRLNVTFMLTKPVKQDELYYYLNSITEPEFKNIQSVNLNQSQANDNLINSIETDFEIMVAEDTPLNMMVISNMLKSILPNVHILEAKNGIEAIQIMKTHKPKIVLMDVQMPELDGLEATKQIRKLNNGVSLPVIALTAGVSKEERELCFKSGMDDFLSKPIDNQELRRIIKKYLFDVKVIKEDVLIDNSRKLNFDREKLLTKIGNENVLENILEMSKTEYPKYITEVENAIITDNAEQIKHMAHKLKGSALNLEFVRIGELSLQIENNITNKQILKKLLQELKAEWEVVSNLINSK